MKYGLIGEKLGHSYSPEIHAKLFGYDYSLFELSPNELESFFKERDFSGINVTIPYKTSVIKYLDFISDEAKAIGAVNTVVNRLGKLFGYNTDFFGLKSMLLKTGIDLSGKKTLILGSGGTSKTASAVASALGASAVIRVSRSGKEGCITYPEAYAAHSDAEAIINTTPCGMYPNVFSTPVEVGGFGRLRFYADAVFNPLRTLCSLRAEAAGAKTCLGLYMLVSQAALSGELFSGIKPGAAATEKVFGTVLKSKQNIVLVGMPGVGKTTVGRAAAKKLSRPFYDIDELIVNKTGRSVPEIFKSYGEEYFRRIETETIKEVACLTGAVIAAGGGSVLRGENVEALKLNGAVYFLDRPVASITATEGRPLSGSRDKLLKLYSERYGIYCSVAERRIFDKTAAEATEAISEDFKI